MSVISSIKLSPTAENGYDLRDKHSEHFLGKATNTITDGSTITGSYTIDGATVAASAIKENDVITDSTGHQFIARTVSNALTWVKITPTAPTADVQDVTVDGTSVLNTTSHTAEFVTTGGISGETAYSSSNPLTTKSYVDALVEELPQAMIFRGTLGAQDDSPTITALPTAGADYVGDVYQVITKGTYASQAAEVGDLFVCAQGGTAGSPTYSWVLIPSGDVPEGTVTQINTGAGLTTESGSAITSTGTIKANLDSYTALSGSDMHYVGVDSNGKLAVVTPSQVDTPASYAYDASTNPLATKNSAAAQISTALDALDFTASGGDASKTLTALVQADGAITTATFTDIAITNSQITDITRNGAVTGFSANTDVITGVDNTSTDGTQLVYVGMSDTDSECLVFTPVYTHSTTANTAVSRIICDDSSQS